MISGGDMSMINNPETESATTNGPAPIAVYLYAGDQIIENVTMGYFYYQDSLGNTSHVTDAAGNLKESYTYSPFGTNQKFCADGNNLIGGNRHTNVPFLRPNRRGLSESVRWRTNR